MKTRYGLLAAAILFSAIGISTYNSCRSTRSPSSLEPDYYVQWELLDLESRRDSLIQGNGKTMSYEEWVSDRNANILRLDALFLSKRSVYPSERKSDRTSAMLGSSMTVGLGIYGLAGETDDFVEGISSLILLSGLNKLGEAGTHDPVECMARLEESREDFLLKWHDLAHPTDTGGQQEYLEDLIVIYRDLNSMGCAVVKA